MKNFMVLGCSYSALYYHPDPRWSYVWLLKEALGAKNLLNLAFGGNSPAGCTRILQQYLANPYKGLPDFIYCQVPGGAREEYYLSDPAYYPLTETSYFCNNEFLTSKQGLPSLRDDRAFDDYKNFIRPTDNKFISNEELVANIPWNQIVLTVGTLFNETNKDLIQTFKQEFSKSINIISDNSFNLQASWADGRLEEIPTHKNIIKEMFMFWVMHKKNQLQITNTVRKEISIMQRLAKTYNIPIVFNTSDNIMVNHEKKEFGKNEPGFVLETNDDLTTHYDSMIDFNNVIKYESIAVYSKTWTDLYWDNHPGRQSHENYFNAIWPKINALFS